ncbi:MAG TPA: hypothetical protein EYN93_03145 [Planctomycetaceae bacterium]|nr:hypothetical protein [Planctomycetaceae bacterium]
MPSQKPFAIITDDHNRARGHAETATKCTDMLSRPDEMVELLIKTQPYRSDQKFRLDESCIEDEFAWLCSFRIDNESTSTHFHRALRLAYHAGYLIKNRDEPSNQRQEDLLDALHGICDSFTPTTSLQRVLVSCEIACKLEPLVALPINRRLLID